MGAWEATDPDASNNATGATVTRTYTAGGTQLASITTGGDLLITLGDVQGSAQLTIGPAGTTGTNAYTPYGTKRTTATPLAPGHGWLNQIADATGLTYLNARYYDPTLGRFISPDPIIDSADPSTLDPYRYADNNPVNYSDSRGLSPSCGGMGKNQMMACYSNYAAADALGRANALSAKGASAQSFRKKFEIALYNLGRAQHFKALTDKSGLELGLDWLGTDGNWTTDTTNFYDGDRLVEDLKQSEFFQVDIYDTLIEANSRGVLETGSKPFPFTYNHSHDASLWTKLGRIEADGIAALRGDHGLYFNEALSAIGSFAGQGTVTKRTDTAVTVQFDVDNTTSMASLLAVSGTRAEGPVNTGWDWFGAGIFGFGDSERQHLQFSMTFPVAALGSQ
jgi:RHS repeat-associated protein